MTGAFGGSAIAIAQTLQAQAPTQYAPQSYQSTIPSPSGTSAGTFASPTLTLNPVPSEVSGAAADSLIFFPDRANPVENGPWVITDPATGALTRSFINYRPGEIAYKGSRFTDQITGVTYELQADAIVDTDAQTWTPVSVPTSQRIIPAPGNTVTIDPVLGVQAVVDNAVGIWVNARADDDALMGVAFAIARTDTTLTLTDQILVEGINTTALTSSFIYLANAGGFASSPGTRLQKLGSVIERGTNGAIALMIGTPQVNAASAIGNVPVGAFTQETVTLASLLANTWTDIPAAPTITTVTDFEVYNDSGTEIRELLDDRKHPSLANRWQLRSNVPLTNLTIEYEGIL